MACMDVVFDEGQSRNSQKNFWAVQVACAVETGVTKLIFGTVEHMRNNRTHVLLKLDFSNAFNTVWRSAVLKACYENPEWRHLYRFLCCTLSPKSTIVGIHNLSCEGMQQGDSAGSNGFCMSLQPLAKWADAQPRAAGGRAPLTWMVDTCMDLSTRF